MKQDYLDVLWQLREHHSLFAEFWSVGHLTESQAIPTAAIAWDKEGRGLQFLINPEFWESLTDHTKAFVIGHECLHAYYEHGQRSIGLDRKLANIAQDIVINHCLINTFGFKREELVNHDGDQLGEQWCWRDTCFPGRDDIEPDRCFEYYYGLLEEQGDASQEGEGEPGQGEPGEGEPGQGGSSGPQTVDSHEFLEDIDPETLEAMKDVIDDMADRMTPDEIEDFDDKAQEGNPEEANKAKQAGNMPGNFKMRVKLGRVIKKRKWETVVVDVLGRFGGMERDVDTEVWTRQPTWMTTIPTDFLLPTDIEETVIVRDRIDIWFFQDVSGSCVQYAERFFRAAASIPDDRFRLRGFCFDTRVHEIDLKKGEIKGGGGTAFQPMEDRIQQIMAAEGCKYPQAVFCITDGYGNNIHPEHPERWHWFLTDEDSYWGGDQKRYIPSKSSYYELKDYE